MISRELQKNYEDVAKLFDEKNDPTKEVWKAGEIKEYMIKNGVTPNSLFQPSDMCYNHTPKPLDDGEDDFEHCIHVFEYLDWNTYKVLGTNYPYTGEIIRKRRSDKKEIIVGEWLNGSLIEWDRNKYLDIKEYESSLIQYADEISDEIDKLPLKGEEKEILIKARVNQSVFRKRLLNRYSHCCLCNVSDEGLLNASHIKPWSKSLPEERVDVNNGFLFCPNHDRLFDKGYISFDDNGNIMISKRLSDMDKVFMNVNENMRIDITEGNKTYLSYHRNIFE